MSDSVPESGLGGASAPYVLRYSHNVIEHLGLKLYQNKPTNVLAELLSNSWDADASWVSIVVREADGRPASVAVSDDGLGMGESELREKYLVVGTPKRADNAADRSPGGRMLMGRKGIGKLAPFGVARVVDLLTVRGGILTWLRFDYLEMSRRSSDGTIAGYYEPEVIADRVALATARPSLAAADTSTVAAFFERMATTGHGTLVLAGQLSLRRPLQTAALLESLGRRFTVTMLRTDFRVEVNGVAVDEAHAFPEWELRVPAAGFAEASVDVNGQSRLVRHWVGFVKSASWPQDEAGVGVYAHGKIAQDRPFFFGNRGNEVYSRYMYGVVEADWIDELDRDTISTDRTSVDWSDEDLEHLYRWGATMVKSWIQAYEANRKAKASEENANLVNDAMARDFGLRLRDTERRHLVDLLSSVTPRMVKDLDERNRLVDATIRAWTHEPARRLINNLWQETAKFDVGAFVATVNRLADELVPESLSLAVVFAQRVFALTQLEAHILRGQETQLQKLIEDFPWILSKGYERFVARRSLKKVCEDAEAAGEFTGRRVSREADYQKPDFVFFASTEEKDLLIVELKGPGDSADFAEFEQLQAYMNYVQSRYRNAEVRGILVAASHDAAAQRTMPASMACLKWQDVLLRSRREHMDLLAALLAGADADAGDSQVQMVMDLGGDVVRAFLERMATHDSRLHDVVRRHTLLAPKPADGAADDVPLG